MNESYLLDTNIIIDFLANKPHAITVVKSVMDCPLYISSLIIGEYYEGVYRSIRNPNNIEKYFEEFIRTSRTTILPVTHQTAKLYARLQADFHRKGYPKPIIDLYIAATCLEHNLILITANKKDFTGIKNLHIL